MTNEEILQKAIEKAEKNGWKSWIAQDRNSLEIITGLSGDVLEIHYGDKLWSTLRDIIFSHDFAKALWGEKLWDLEEDSPKQMYSKSGYLLPAWQYHLQQMVLEEKPIRYLERFI